MAKPKIISGRDKIFWTEPPGHLLAVAVRFQQRYVSESTMPLLSFSVKCLIHVNSFLYQETI